MWARQEARCARRKIFHSPVRVPDRTRRSEARCAYAIYDEGVRDHFVDICDSRSEKKVGIFIKISNFKYL